MRLALLFMMLAAASTSALAADEERAVRYGWAVMVGTGLKFGGLGAAVERQVALSELVRLTPSLGFGVSNGGDEDHPADYFWLGGTLGLNVEIGRAHRVIFGPQLYLAHDVKNSPAGAPIPRRTLAGPSVIAGYKGTASFGLVWEISGGVAYHRDPFDVSDAFSFSPHVGLGLGYKF